MKNSINIILNNDLPEITFYSLIEGELTKESKSFFEERLAHFAQNFFSKYDGIEIYVSFFEYSNNCGVLLTIAHNWNELYSIENLDLYSLYLEVVIILSFQHILLNAVYSCICHFPHDDDFFGVGFSRNTMVIIIGKDFFDCTDYGGNKSEKWTNKVKSLGKYLELENWSDL